MRVRTVLPLSILLVTACGGEETTGPEPARCELGPTSFNFGFFVLPLADQDPLDFSGTVEITNDPAQRTDAGAEDLPISLSVEMITTLPVPPRVFFGSPTTELLIPPYESTSITFNVEVDPNTSPGVHQGRIRFGSLCEDATFRLELEGRPLPPPQYAGSIGAFGTGPGQFDSPEALAFDETGRAYVVDTGNDRIQVFDAAWTPLFQFHDVAGAQGLTGPTGIAVRNGVIVVGDKLSGSGRVAAFDMTGAAFESFGTGRPSAQFVDLHRVGLDAEGLIYCADGVGKRVEVFRLTGEDVGWEKVRQWGSGGDGPGQFHLAYGLHVVGDEVFVTDQGGDRINRFTLTGEFLARWGETGTNGGKFRGPRGFAFTGDGNVLVVDAGNLRIQMLTPQGEFLTSWGATRGAAVMESPRDVAVDAAGDIYVVDGVGGNRILRFRFP